MLRPAALVVHRGRNAQPAQRAAGNFTMPPGSKGMVTPPGHWSSCRCQSSAKALLGKYDPCRTSQALQKIAISSARYCTGVLARYARSICNSFSVRFWAAKSLAMASVTLASGTLAGDTGGWPWGWSL